MGRDTREKVAKHYREYGSKPEILARQVKRVQARREMVKKYGEAALKGKDIDHKTPLDRGGSNSPSNLRIVDPKTNRGWKKGGKKQP
jgi:5-methylcytosine-specific restriction endonuclease McrA